MAQAILQGMQVGSISAIMPFLASIEMLMMIYFDPAFNTWSLRGILFILGHSFFNLIIHLRE